MDFNLKNYRVFKVKNYFKKCNFFFFFHSIKVTSTEWVVIEQYLKKLKLKYYKILNGTTRKTIDNSIYKNFTQLISGTILLVEPQFKTTVLNLNLLEKELKILFALLSIKLNDKIYSVEQLKNFKVFSYKQNMFYLFQLLEKSSKLTYVLTSDSKKSK